MDSGGNRRTRVLLVDDEPRNLTLGRAMLKGEYEVVEAPDAATAYRVLEGGDIDLVLLDVMMPGIDGFTACHEIKERFGSPYLPVLLLTALGDQDQRNRGLEAGADEFLTKPIDRRELQLRVRAFVRLRAQDKLIRRQVEELRRVDHMKDELAAMMVHDLRNPLAGADGFLQLIRRDPGGDQQQKLDWAMAALRNLRALIDDMLKVRMLEDASFQVERQTCSLRAVLVQASDELRGDAELRGLTLAVAEGDREVPLDAGLVRRAVENLVINALRYGKPGSEVSLRVVPMAAADEVAIDVADRGPGVPDAHKAVLFEKYGSVEAKNGNARTGNGLGLFMVKLTAEAHGGRAVALDRPDGGSIFRIVLGGCA